MNKDIQRRLRENFGRRVGIWDRNIFHRFFLYGDIQQERPRANFVFINPLQTDSQVIFTYGAIPQDNFEVVFPGNPADSLEIRPLIENHWLHNTGGLIYPAGHLYTRTDIQGFKNAVREYNPTAPFLHSRALTLLKEGVHI